MPLEKFFDWRRYRREYNDLSHLDTALCVCRHFIEYGLKEKRRAYVYRVPDGSNIVAPMRYFHTFKWRSYKATQINSGNTDAIAWVDYTAFTHWCEQGQQQLRSQHNQPTTPVHTYTNDIVPVIIQPEPNMFLNLSEKYNNIDRFMESILPYRRILFISGDTPGYGGSATLCDNLQKFVQLTTNHITLSIYYQYNNSVPYKPTLLDIPTIVYKPSDNIKIINTIHKFKPDLILFKSPLQIDYNSLPTCRKIFILGGIYKNSMNEYYTDLKTVNEHKRYINTDVIHTIQQCDISYSSCEHTRDILKQCYNIVSPILYSTFIPFYRNSIPIVPESHDFQQRKYEYALIVSDFTRPIKNIKKSIEFLKHKRRVILIGNNSSIYQTYGDDFECVGLITHSELKNYYSSIKYIRQDSFYESCSNVIVEGVFYGCKISSELSRITASLFEDHFINIPPTITTSNLICSIQNNNTTIRNVIHISYDHIDKSMLLHKNIQYIIGNVREYYTVPELAEPFNDDEKTVHAYFVDTPTVSEFAFVVKMPTTTLINLKELFEMATFIPISLGDALFYYKLNISDTPNSYEPAIHMYYLYGMVGISLQKIGLNLFYDEYVSEFLKILKGGKVSRSFNRKMILLCCAYYFGSILEKNYVDIIQTVISLTPFHTKTALFISKLIRGYGGVQKTSHQIVEMLDREYDITILSQHTFLKTANNGVFNLNHNRINRDIPTCLLLQLSSIPEIENYINSTPFDQILNNKLNEALSWKLNKKITCLCHNSMDGFNEIIYKNQQKIQAVMVINQFHVNLLKYINIRPEIYQYHNHAYITKPDKIKPRTKFTRKIAFIGRLSTEKNVQCLIDGVNLFNHSLSYHDKITLLIIGSGSCTYTNLTEHTVLSGYYDHNEILKLYDQVDYIISASITEGKPFSIIEAQSMGIPCIHSNINGINEIIFDDVNGFTFNFANDVYDPIKTNTTFENLNLVINNNNKYKVSEVLNRAYNIDIGSWNSMSDITYSNCGNIYEKRECDRYNLNSLSRISAADTTILSPLWSNETKKNVFINFKPNPAVAYGGGNISVHYIISHLNIRTSDFNVVYELSDNIDAYLIIDPFKSRDGFKKYSLQNVIDHRNKLPLTSRGKLVIRVNDCDITRSLNPARSRENEIIKHFTEIDYFIFNSNFIKEYYESKLKKLRLLIPEYKSTVIINGCCPQTFQSLPKSDCSRKLKIVTHHWSNNPNKGYQTYYNLWKYVNDHPELNIEFVFIGKSSPEEFSKMPIIGPLVPTQINKELNSCHVYITDSRYDSCPNHVIEAISCGLPILYSNVPGGAKELCTMSSYTIGEMFEPHPSSVLDLLNKLETIRNNYSFYIHNVEKSRELFKSEYCTSKYYTALLRLTEIPIGSAKKLKIDIHFVNNVIQVTVKTDELFININGRTTKLIKGINVFSLHISPETHGVTSVYLFGPITKHRKHIHIYVRDFDNRLNSPDTKLSNNRPNIVLCSDSNYLVGLFAVLHSVITNSRYTHEATFNFIVPFSCCHAILSKTIMEFKKRLGVDFDTTIIYVVPEILDPVLFQSKCYNGGGHLLNLGNLSRLLLGEYTSYKKAMYLDADSIVQYDIIEKLIIFDVSAPIYAGKADRICTTNNKKQITIKMSSILDCTRDWSDLIDGVSEINKDEYVFMGAPFIANCTQWRNVYRDMVRIIEVHNQTDGGIYKLFTMSLQNIIFYNKTKNINEIISTLQDLGSARKDWTRQEIVGVDVLDWSGMYKPWFTNGLYSNLWIKHDILNLSEPYGEIDGNKHNKKIEHFSTVPIEAPSSNTYTFIHINPLYFDPSVPNQILIEFDIYLKSFVLPPDNIDAPNISKIAYVCDANYLLTKMSRVRFWAIETIGRRSDVQVTLTGPGFLNFNPSDTLQKNILNLSISFNLVIWYKPLDHKYNFDPAFEKTYKKPFPFKTCLRYNEMWDIDWTTAEIKKSRTDIIICHHHNDYIKYKKLNSSMVLNAQFYYIPHCANPNIFKPLTDASKNIDILISGVTKQKHYPLKHRLNNILKSPRFAHLNVHAYEHPGYSGYTNFKNTAQIDYNRIINQSKLCIACTSKYKYRLGKYVEIPMAGGILVGDIPEPDGHDEFNDFIVPINDQMTTNKIIDIITSSVNKYNSLALNTKRERGLKWAATHTPETYAETFMSMITHKIRKIFIISDEIRDNHPEFGNEKWICDVLKREFYEAFPESISHDPMKADIIWYLAPWNFKYTPHKTLRDKWLSHLLSPSTTVIFTQHHIDPEKFKGGQLTNQFLFMNTYGTHFHAICNHTMNDMLPHFPLSKTSRRFLWINDTTYFHINNKEQLRTKLGLASTDYLIGSFQKDTEGRTNSPKLSKGPDIFVNIIRDLFKTNPNIRVVLTGLRREYIMNELTKSGIPYYYFNMVSLETINELYNCLDLYIVASRCEGGPRAVVECGLTKTPIISTRVGISPELMPQQVLFDADDWMSYTNTRSNKELIEYLHHTVSTLTKSEYLQQFHQYLLDIS